MHPKSITNPFRKNGKFARGDVAGRLWAKVDKRGHDACWPYLGAKFHYGHGAIYAWGKQDRAHRVSWILANGPIPDGLNVLHKCDNPPCVNPAHLFLGTDADNIRDMNAKGRDRTLRGDEDPKSKLTEEQVKQIRQLYKPYVVSQHALAVRFGVSRGAIEAIVHGENWRHVK